MNGSGERAPLVQDRIDNYFKPTAVEHQLHCLPVKALLCSQRGTILDGIMLAVRDFTAVLSDHFADRAMEQLLRRAIAADDPLIGIQQPDRAVHGIEVACHCWASRSMQTPLCCRAPLR